MNKIQRSDIALLVLRIGISISFIFVHGYDKFIAGAAGWENLGKNMQHLGITWLPVFWGFMAMAAEFFGGICLLLGILVRPAAFLLLCTMLVAIVSNLRQGYDLEGISQNIELSGVFLCLMIAGGGNLSILYPFKRS